MQHSDESFLLLSYNFLYQGLIDHEETREEKVLMSLLPLFLSHHYLKEEIEIFDHLVAYLQHLKVI